MLKSNVLNSFYSKFLFNSVRFVRRGAFKMDTNKAYLRHCTDGEHFDLSFELKNDRVNRLFNFSRKLSEPVDSFLARVKVNVDKAVNKKKKKKSTSDDILSSIALTSNKEEVPKERTCDEVFRPGSAVQLSINEQTFDVIINAPWVLTLNLPTSILANFPTYPSKFEGVYTDKELSEFTWYRSKDKVEWEVVGKNFIYVPSNADINCYLKMSCVPKNEEFEGPVVETETSCQVQASPGECPFERRHAFTKEKLKGQE